MPLISIITPVYNVEKYLHRCLESILSQSFHSYDLILVDDGSTDSSGKICDEYANNYDNIHVVHQYPNGGISKARNTGLDWVFRHSDSQWIAFIDSDDWVHPDYLSTLLHAAESANVPLSICNHIKTDGTIPAQDISQPSVTICSSEDFFVDNHLLGILLWGKLCQKRLFANLRFPLGKYHEDEFIAYKPLFATEKFAFVEAPPMYYYFTNPTGFMSAPWSPKNLDLLEAFKERLYYFKSHNHKKAYHWQAKFYYEVCYRHHKSLLENKPENTRKYEAIIQRHFRRALRHLRLTKEVSFRSHTYLYENHYPRLMWLYWTGKACIGKIFKRK